MKATAVSILDPDDLSYAIPPKSQDDPRHSLRQPKYRNREDHKDDQEEQPQWQQCIKNCLEHMKNTYVVVKEWMDKDEALWLESKLGLDPNGELESISLINMTHPSLEKALDEINPRDTNSWEIMDNKTSNDYHRHGMIETIFLPIDIHEDTPLELEKEDDINEHGSYFMKTLLNPHSYEKSHESICLSNIATHDISNPLVLPIHKDFERVVVDAYVYHKYFRSHCVNLKIGVGGETTSPT
jgi:hypothetical protein